MLYVYDVFDRRISKTIDADGDGTGGATEEHFVYDGSHIALVFDGQGNLTHRYFHGPQIDQILAEETASGGTRWALTDHQGSVRDVIDNSGSVLNHITYDSFGQVTSETDPSFDFRFGYTGRERDEESDLMYYRARYFDPATGTFVGEDPLGFAAGDANLYRYVFNSSTNFTDPDGQIAVAIAVGVPIAVVAVGAAAIYAHNQLQSSEAQNAIGDGLQGIGDTLSNLNQSLEQQTRNASQNIRNNARRYRNLADGAIGALPTTVATPGAFERPAQDFPIPQSPPANFTPEKPTNGVGNPNAINEPISRSIPIDLLCPPWLNDDGKLELPSYFESGISDIPDDWITKPSRGEGGTIYINPDNPHDRVRVMPGNPKSPHASQRRPYVIRQKDGKYLDKDGNEVDRQSAESHIPLEDFEFLDP